MCRDFVVWLPTRLQEHLIAEANRFEDIETGGVLMGYWYTPAILVVTANIDGGPNALHEPHAFAPDQDWQITEIARHYHASGRRETYIGDWHTHPGANSGHLSWKDRRILRRIINTPAARAPHPLMVVLHGSRDAWQLTGWVASLKTRPILWATLLLTEVPVRRY
jgi:integrative and conjugative element protein (TIGR02256 family)